MQIIRRSSFAASPWKNGGGITHEIIRVPAGVADFRWRLSVAQVDVSGPFSNFAGYQRTLVLLRGAGVRLCFGGAPPVSLTTVGAMARFDGALETDCQLLAGSCSDLNLMVDGSVHDLSVRVEAVAERRSVPSAASGRGIVLVFSIAGGLCVGPDGRPAERLGAWDLGILPANGKFTMAPEPAGGASSLVFFATLDDNLPSILPR